MSLKQADINRKWKADRSDVAKKQNSPTYSPAWYWSVRGFGGLEVTEGVCGRAVDTHRWQCSERVGAEQPVLFASGNNSKYGPIKCSKSFTWIFSWAKSLNQCANVTRYTYGYIHTETSACTRLFVNKGEVHCLTSLILIPLLPFEGGRQMKGKSNGQALFILLFNETGMKTRELYTACPSPPFRPPATCVWKGNFWKTR